MSIAQDNYGEDMTDDDKDKKKPYRILEASTSKTTARFPRN